jgi:hypothetical protein
LVASFLIVQVEYFSDTGGPVKTRVQAWKIRWLWTTLN